MKASAKKRLALVTHAPVETKAPTTREERLAAAKEWLGRKWVLHPKYERKVRVGSMLTAWASDFARKRATESGKPAA